MMEVHLCATVGLVIVVVVVLLPTHCVAQSGSGSKLDRIPGRLDIRTIQYSLEYSYTCIAALVATRNLLVVCSYRWCYTTGGR